MIGFGLFDLGTIGFEFIASRFVPKKCGTSKDVSNNAT